MRMWKLFSVPSLSNTSGLLSMNFSFNEWTLCPSMDEGLNATKQLCPGFNSKLSDFEKVQNIKPGKYECWICQKKSFTNEITFKKSPLNFLIHKQMQHQLIKGRFNRTCPLVRIVHPHFSIKGVIALEPIKICRLFRPDVH